MRRIVTDGHRHLEHLAVVIPELDERNEHDRALIDIYERLDVKSGFNRLRLSRDKRRKLTS